MRLLTISFFHQIFFKIALDSLTGAAPICGVIGYCNLQQDITAKNQRVVFNRITFFSILYLFKLLTDSKLSLNDVKNCLLITGEEGAGWKGGHVFFAGKGSRIKCFPKKIKNFSLSPFNAQKTWPTPSFNQSSPSL